MVLELTSEENKTSSGSVTRTVTYYPVAGAMRVNSTLYYTLKDHLGSASVITDASGNIVGETRYFPYGETRFTTGTMYTDKLYTGQREMTGLGIYHYQARFYSPRLGRFLSADSIVPNPFHPQDLNRFSYVRNNPVRYIDPSGHAVTPGDDGGCGKPNCGLPLPPPCSSSICNPNGGGGGGGGNTGKESPEESNDTPPSALATAGMVSDTIAMTLNGGYALVGDLIFLVCQGCYPAVVGIYQYYSYIPNTFSTIAMGLWIMDGIETGENTFTLTPTPQGITVSLSVSQDTLVAVGTNILGWTLLKEPNAAFAVDAAVAGYDLWGLGAIPLLDDMPAWMNPTITYNTNTGWDFSWQQK